MCMKKILFLQKLAAVTLSASMLLTPMLVNADARDSDIYNFSISATSWQRVKQTRPKDNKTSVYCYIKSASNSVLVQTWGCDKDKNLKKNCTRNSKNKATKKVKLKIGIEYQIYNNIKEKGYPNATIRIKSNNAVKSDVINGKWSPDSVKTKGMKVAN